MSVGQLKAHAETEPCVVGISHNRSAFASEISPDPMGDSQTHLRSIGLAPLLPELIKELEQLPEPTVIAIIDTGIDLNHADLRDHLWTNRAELEGKPGVDDDLNGYVDDIYGYNFGTDIPDPTHQTVNDHGTHVAGLSGAITANGIGVAGVMGRASRIMPLNVFGGSWSSDTVDIDEAIRYAADNGADIINISVGGPGESETTAYAIGKGAVVVASAGNLSQDIGREFYYPASYASRFDGMIAVGAIDATSSALCESSNFGPREVEVLAPGCDQTAPKSGLLSTRSDNRYGHKKGTSRAAPIVAGGLALGHAILRAKSQGTAAPAEFEALLLDTCEKRPSLAAFSKRGCVLDLAALIQSSKRNR